MKRSTSYQVRVVGDGTVRVPLKAGYASLLDRIFGLTRKRLNALWRRNRDVNT